MKISFAKKISTCAFRFYKKFFSEQKTRTNFLRARKIFQRIFPPKKISFESPNILELPERTHVVQAPPEHEFICDFKAREVSARLAAVL